VYIVTETVSVAFSGDTSASPCSEKGGSLETSVVVIAWEGKSYLTYSGERLERLLNILLATHRYLPTNKELPSLGLAV
jgi:hypothetical protein